MLHELFSSSYICKRSCKAYVNIKSLEGHTNCYSMLHELFSSSYICKRSCKAYVNIKSLEG